MSRKPERKTYNATELAAVLGIDESTVRRLARQHGHVEGIRAIRIGDRKRGRWIFSRAEVNELLRPRTERAA